MGDTMPGGILHYEEGQDYCSQELRDILGEADIRVATLETAVGDEPLFDEGKMRRDKDVIYCPINDLRRLKELDINVVSLANNHAWDLGIKGIETTFRELDKIGILYTGAGHDLKEASRPAIIEVKGKKVAFIAFCDNKPGTCGYIPVATKSTPGINLMEDGNICSQISRLKGKFDYLFVMMHWGKEYYYYPTPEVNRLARKIIDWGADGVIGSHSHQIQPTIFYKGRPIILSLGNFFFPDRLITKPRSTYYPEEKPNLENIPRTNGYPFVEEPTFKLWKEVARKGQVVSIIAKGEKFKTTPVITALDKESHVGVAHTSLPSLFKLSHKLVNLPLYKQLFFAMRGSRYIRKKIKGEL